MNKRDNFNRKTIEILAKRVGYLCSNPDCKNLTVGPSSDDNKSISIGVAAHITAASINGPRYDKNISNKERASISNGIWLCQNCSVLIDRDENKYTCELLKSWKKFSENQAIKTIEGRNNLEPFYNVNLNNKQQIFSKNQVIFYNSEEKGVYCKIMLPIDSETLFFNYFPEKGEWDITNQEPTWDSPFFYTFEDLKNWLQNGLESKNANEILKRIEKIRMIVTKKGIYGVSEFMFDIENKDHGIPKYSEFVKAFKLYSKKDDIDFKVQAVGHLIYIKTLEMEYIIDTYEGKTKELKWIIQNKSYDEIYTMTDENIWSEIYLDLGIEKEKFIPILLRYWEDYWDDLYNRIKNKTGRTEHLEKLKDISWRQFQMFSDGYKDVVDIIKYAYELGDTTIYPLAVITMMEIFNPEICYEEYCEFEFEFDEWESIMLDKKNHDSLFFYIKKN